MSITLTKDDNWSADAVCAALGAVYDTPAGPKVYMGTSPIGETVVAFLDPVNGQGLLFIGDELAGFATAFNNGDQPTTGEHPAAITVDAAHAFDVSGNTIEVSEYYGLTSQRRSER